VRKLGSLEPSTIEKKEEQRFWMKQFDNHFLESFQGAMSRF
jgi:hypothetical protein